MTRSRAKLVALCAAILAFSLSAFAQSYHPEPAKTTVICAGCPGKNHHGQDNAGLPTHVFTSPIVRHTGRYMDSTQTGDVQNLGMRTVRAMDLTIAPSRNRIYSRFGSTFVAYALDKFATTVGRGLVPISNYSGTGPFVREGSNKIEGVAPLGQYVYAEATGNGWTATGGGDGGERLFGYDYDDRGYVYLAYGPYYWGIFNDPQRNDGAHMEHISHFDTSTRTTHLQAAYKILSLRIGSQYYMIVADSGQIEIYNVTDPLNPGPGVFTRDLQRAFRRFAKNPTANHVAIIDNGNSIGIWTASSFVDGGPPIVRFQAPAGYAYNDVVFDGTRFWAISANMVNGDSGNTIVPIVPSGDTYSLGIPVTLGAFQPSFLNYGDGYLGIAGLERSTPGSNLYVGTARLLRIDGVTLQNIELNDFFKNYYTYAPLNFARPLETDYPPQGLQPFRDGNKLHVIWADFGLGDVFEVEAIAEGLRVNPPQGASAGGESVAISGTGLEAGSVRVFFGDAEAFVDTASSTPAAIRVITPSHVSATVDVVVKSGQQVLRAPNGFTFSGCTYDLSPLTGVHASGSGTGSVQVVTAAGCSWTATAPNNSFASILSGSGSGTGPGVAVYYLNSNAGSTSRTTTLTVAGKSFEVTQNAAGVGPITLNADAAASQVALLWTAAQGASSYAVLRSSGGGPFAAIQTTNSLTHTDTSVVAGTGYVYQIIARNGSGQAIGYSNADLAVPFSYTDPSITLGTPIRAVHFTDLRTAITAARTALRFAVRPFALPLSSGVFIQRSHLVELRSAIDAVRASVGLAPTAYTDTTVTAGATRVRSAHVLEMRRSLQ